jgi:tape measure domain-containing protein
VALNIGELFGRISFDTSGAMSALEAIETQVALIGAAAGAAFGAAAKAGIDFASKMQQAEVGLTTMLGSTEAAQAQLEDLKEFAKATPFEMDGLLQSQNRLMAMGFAAEDVIPMLGHVGDAVAAMGGGEAEIGRVVTAFGQLNSKGKATTQEMNQLLETGTYSWRALADTLGVSTAEAMKMVEKGVVSSTTLINSYMANSHAKFGGMMAAQAQTFAGQMSTLKDTVRQTLGDMFLPLMRVLSQVTAAFNALDEETQKQIVQFGVLSSGAVAFASGLALAAKQAQAMGPALLQMAKASLPLAASWAAVAVGVAGVVLLIGAAEQAFQAMGTSWGEVLDDMLDGLSEWMTTAWKWWDDLFTNARDGWIKLAEAMGLVTGAQAQGLMQGSVMGDIGAFADSIAAATKDNVVDPIIASFKTGLGVLGSGLGSVLSDAVKDAMKGAVADKPFQLDDPGGGGGTGGASAGMPKGIVSSYDAGAAAMASVNAGVVAVGEETGLTLEEMAQRVADARASLGAAFTSSFQGLIDGFKQGQVLGSGVFGIMATLLTSSDQFQRAQEVLAKGFQGLSNGVGALITGLMPLIRTVGNLLSVVGQALAPVFRELGERISAQLQPTLNALGPVLQAFGTIMAAISQAMGGVREIMSGALEPAFKALHEVMKGVAWVALAIAWALGKAWNAVLDAIIAVVDLFVKKNSDVLKKLEGMKVDTDAISESMKTLGQTTDQLAASTTTAASAMATVTASAAETASSLTNLPQAFKTSLARYTVADSVPGFASGGYVSRPTLAMIGEGGEPEFVVPESKMAALMGGGGGGGITIHNVNVQASNMRELVREINREAGRQGMAKTGRKPTSSPFVGR